MPLVLPVTVDFLANLLFFSVFFLFLYTFTIIFCLLVYLYLLGQLQLTTADLFAGLVFPLQA